MAKKKLNEDLLADQTATHTIILGGNSDQFAQMLADRQERPEVIKQAIIVDGTKLSVTHTIERKSGIETTSKKCPDPVHDDLRIAFAKLNDHLGRLCYQPLMENNPPHENDKAQPKRICSIHCTGFKLAGNDDNEGVTLFGSRTLPNAKSLDLQSPQQRWYSDIYEYEEISELRAIIAECVNEVELYLFEGKHQPDNQMSLFPEEEEYTGDEEQEGE